ncbi:MAG: hypothetical protein AB7P03_03545 [Kofleriaceae bacterium]
MDVTTLQEPTVTDRARRLLANARAQLTAAQLSAMERWNTDVPFDAGVLNKLHNGPYTFAWLRVHASKLSWRPREDMRFDERLSDLGALLDAGAERPVVASAIAWDWLGKDYPELASHVIRVIRDRAGLPGLRRRIAAGEPFGGGPEQLHVTWFADRQLEDLAQWIEHVPAPTGDTLVATAAAVEAQRASAERVSSTELAAFMRETARFLLHISERAVDPLGFPLAREAQLDSNPSPEQRHELAIWARRQGHAICLRGELMIMRIAVQSPWPLRLELIAAELGRGSCGGAGLLLRLAGDHALGQVAPVPVPVLLCLRDEPIAERGPRFERWLSVAYPQAVDAWRPWS